MNSELTKAFKKLRADAESSDELFCVKCALLKYLYDKGFYFDVEAALPQICIDFRFDAIASVWAGEAVRVYEEASNALTDGQRELLTALLYSEQIDLSGQTPCILGEVYQLLLSAEERRTCGITYTPEDILEYMTDILRDNITPNDRLLDPACGAGYFLCGGYNALMTLLYPNSGELTIKELHESILREHIFGFDISPAACAISRLSLALLYKDFYLCPNILLLDALTQTPQEYKASFDWVLTNPPYVGHKGMDKSYKLALKESYPEVFYDKADLSYCFFALAARLLKEGGSLLFVTSRYFAQSCYADRLREMLLNRFTINRVVDYFGVRPFRYIGVDPMIIYATQRAPEIGHIVRASKLAERGIRAEDILRLDFSDRNEIRVPQRELSADGFIFISEPQRELRRAVEAKCAYTLGELFDIFQGVITGLDRAFVVPDTRDNKELIKECGVRWIKGRQITERIEPFGSFLLYVPNDADIENMPKTLNHLLPYRELLMKRRECASGRKNWYALQWERDKASFENEKIVFPYKSADSRFVCDKSGAFFSADIYGMKPKAEFMGKLSLKNTARLLSSPIYEEYFHTYAKKLGGALYEYYPNTLLRLPLPEPAAISNLTGKRAIEQYFGVRVRKD